MAVAMLMAEADICCWLRLVHAAGLCHQHCVCVWCVRGCSYAYNMHTRKYVSRVIQVWIAAMPHAAGLCHQQCRLINGRGSATSGVGCLSALSTAAVPLRSEQFAEGGCRGRPQSCGGQPGMRVSRGTTDGAIRPI